MKKKLLIIIPIAAAVVAPEPRAVGYDGLRRAVGIFYLKLSEQFSLGAVLIFESPCAYAAPVPAVGKLGAEHVASLMQKRGHIVGLILYALSVFRDAGRERH